MERPDELGAGAASSGSPGATPKTTSSEQEMQQLKAEIADNQAQLQETVAEIQERLSPTHLKDQATEAVREATVGRVQHMMNRAGETVEGARRTTRRAATSVASEVRSSPIPYAMIAIGAAWLLMSKRSQREWDDDDYDLIDDYGSTELASSDYESRAYGSTGVSDDRSSNVAGTIRRARTSLASVGTGARERARRATWRARSGWETMLQENPLVLGVAAIAAGALVAAALPSTEVENRYMGEARESVVESAREVAQTAVEKVAGAGSEQHT